MVLLSVGKTSWIFSVRFSGENVSMGSSRESYSVKDQTQNKFSGHFMFLFKGGHQHYDIQGWSGTAPAHHRPTTGPVVTVCWGVHRGFL